MREIIDQTFENIQSIYRDVARIIKIAEEEMEGSGFKPMGDKATTWGISSSYNVPSSWSYKYFARAYLNKSNLNRAVGFAVHLGGYSSSYINKLLKHSLSLPFVAISALDQKEEFQLGGKQDNRVEIYEWLHGAGWWDEEPDVKRTVKNGIVTEIFEDGSSNRSFFINYLSIGEGNIETLISEPMIQMFKGNENWAARNKLQILPLQDSQ